MHAAFEAIGRFAVRFRYLVIALWIAAAVVIPMALPTLASVVKNDNTQFLPKNSPSTLASNLEDVFQKSGEMPVPVIVSRSGQLSAADVTFVQQLLPKLKAVGTVDTVRDLGRSPDGRAQDIQVLSMVSGGPNNEAKVLVDGLRAAVSSTTAPAGLQVNVTGDLAAQVDTQAKSGNTGGKVQGLSALLILVILLVIFRAPLAPIVTLVPAGIVSLITSPVVAELAKHGLKVSTLAQLLLIVLILGAGTDYGLFLVFRFREHLRAGMAKQDAVVLAVGRVGESITFSAGTVIAALLSLFAASFGVYHDLGAPLAIGIALMLLAALTLLPALLAVFGRAMFWPSRRAPNPDGSPEKVGAWGNISARIVQRPALILGIGVVFFGALASGLAFYQSAGFATGNYPSGTDSLAGSDALGAHFPRASANPTNVVMTFRQDVWTDPAAVATATKSLQSQPVFTTISGPLTPNGGTVTPAQLSAAHQMFGDPKTLAPTPPAGVPAALYAAYRSEAQYVSSDGHTVNFNTGLKAGDASSTAALNATPAVRAAVTKAAAAAGAVKSGVTGEAPALYDVSATSTSDLKAVVPIAILIIGLLLVLVMRSLVAPLYLIVSVGLSYLAALGLSVYVFQEILGDGGLTFILPFLMFLFLLALGEDYNILVMTRIREEAQHTTLRDAVSRALHATGTTVTSAGVVLAGTFAVFAIAGGSGGGGSQIRDVGAGLAIGILMDTFLVRTLLVPSTVVLLGRWNWWPSKMSKTDFALTPRVDDSLGLSATSAL